LLAQVPVPEVPSERNLLEAKLRLEGRAKAGASWFYWIGGLSIINSAIFLTGGSTSFPVGLALTQVIDGFASGVQNAFGTEAAGIVSILALLGNAAIAGGFILAGYLARRGSQAVYIAGMCVYALDAIVSLVFQAWLAAAFHAFALLGLWGGFKALRTFAPIQAGSVPLEAIPPAVVQSAQPRGLSRLAIVLIAAIIAVCGLIYLASYLLSR